MYKFKRVTDLIIAINDVLENTLENVSFCGEISQLQVSSVGHMYFTLKDEESQISCAMWKTYTFSMGFRPKEGDKVECVGRCSLYNKSGRFQMVVTSMKLEGEGDLKKKFEELKKKLELEGLFDEQRKRPLPFFPKAIGVVTSSTGAVIHDIMFKVKERMPICKVYLIDVRVQGEGAAKEISDAIYKFNKLNNVDVLIVGRGGGSLEDLWCFNEECVARAIYASKIPVISAVGHESDVSLSDLVADVRAPTPTGAAQIAVPDRNELRQKLKMYKERFKDPFSYILPYREHEAYLEESLKKAFKHSILNYKLIFEKIKSKIDTLNPKNQVRIKRETLNVLKEKLLKLNPKIEIQNKKEKLENLSLFFTKSLKQLIDGKKQVLLKQESMLKILDYKKTLKRGYSIVKHEGKILTSKKSLKEGDTLNINFYDGKINTKVIK